MTRRTITLSVDMAEDGQAPRIFEVLSRAAAGLLLEGIEAAIYTYVLDEEED